MQEQTDSRLLNILKDGANYAEGVDSAARIELLNRGFSEEQLDSFVSAESSSSSALPTNENSPLDAVWTQYQKEQTAKGLLLMVVFLLVFSILKTLLVYAVLHYRYGQDFSFEVSLLNIFLPMVLSAFSAYSIWKLSSAGWFTGMLFGYGTLVKIALELSLMINNRALFESEAVLWLNEGIKVALDGFIAIFIIAQLSRSVHKQQLRVPENLARVSSILLPVLSILVVTLVYIFGL